MREVSKAAIGRLPTRQVEVINGIFFEQRSPDELAGASRSTIYNHKAKAKKVAPNVP